MAHEAQLEHGAEDHHPSPALYVRIFVVLAVITLVEVAIFQFTGLNSAVMTALILGLSASKFALGVAFYMHLKFDNWRFILLFVSPLVIMISIFIVLLALFSNLTR